MQLKYGNDFIDVGIARQNILGELKLEKRTPKPLDTLLKESILNPIGRPRLVDLLRKNRPHDVVIIVSDGSRRIANYARILKFLVSEIVDAGIDEKNIEFVIALGTHRRNSVEENKLLYGDLTADFHFSQHDCHNNCVSIGRTSTGLEVQVNKRVKNADFVVATGKINSHYLAGFSGGRKAILPGISSYMTIRNNHCKLRRNGVALGAITNNIVAQEMDEASRLFGINYLLNVVETPEHDTAQIFCGDAVFAFEQGLRVFRSVHSLILSQKADSAFVSSGGYPKDRTFYLSHKSLNSAVNIVKKGGSLVLIGQCREGFGDDRFVRYMLNSNLAGLLSYPEEKIEVGGHRAFVTAKILQDYKVYVLSDLVSKELNQMHFIPIKNIDEAINHLRKDYGDKFTTYIIPNGTSILPTVAHVSREERRTI